MFNAISVASACVLTDLRLRLLVGGAMVSRSAVVAVLSVKMRSMYCLHADILVFAHSGGHLLTCLVVSHLQVLVHNMLCVISCCA